MPGGRLEWEVEAHVQAAVRVETLDPLDVGDRHARGEIVAIGRRESVAVPPVQARSALLAELLDQRVMEVVGPRARGLGEPCLDRGDVEVAGGSRVCVDYDVESRQHGLRDVRAEVDADPVERILEDVLDPPTDVRVVSLEREVDEAGQKPVERVPSDEEANPASLA